MSSLRAGQASPRVSQGGSREAALTRCGLTWILVRDVGKMGVCASAPPFLNLPFMLTPYRLSRLNYLPSLLPWHLSL